MRPTGEGESSWRAYSALRSGSEAANFAHAQHCGPPGHRRSIALQRIHSPRDYLQPHKTYAVDLGFCASPIDKATRAIEAHTPTRTITKIQIYFTLANNKFLGNT